MLTRPDKPAEVKDRPYNNLLRRRSGADCALGVDRSSNPVHQP